MTRRKCFECRRYVCAAHRKQVQNANGQSLGFLCLDDFEKKSHQVAQLGGVIMEVSHYWRVIDGEREPYR
jgi:hypothetical protein